jgi:hypothetical protein
MDEAAFNGLPVPFIEIVAAKFAIPGLLREQRVDHDEQAVRHRDSSAFGAPSRRQAPLLSREVGVLGARRRLARFDQGGAQPGAAVARAPTAALARALIVAWTQLPGHSPAHEARWRALGKRVRSTPTSATSTSAVRRPTPGMLCTRATATSKGRTRSAISALTRSRLASRKSMWASCWAIRKR